MINETHNPDVLNCLANLSSDEVFTSPKIANEMLDMLPQELFENPNTTFLDPCTKSGVFLREIAKRLLVGLEKQIPDLQQRINHIFTKQLYGIAITQLTSLLSRRSVYCSKTANGKYSIATTFGAENGNIKFDKIKHTFENHKCKFCGVSDSVETYTRDDSMETYAYQFIHIENPQELFNMKFDVIIGNPPYQLNVGVQQESYAISLYQKFVEQAKKLQPRYLSMIIPSRWFAGGRGLDEFRDEMLHDSRLRILHDFIDSSECFTGVEIKGGVCYFLWDRDNKGLCEIYTHENNTIIKSIRPLLEDNSNIFIRYNQAIPIINKIKSFKEDSFRKLVSSQTPFGFVSSFKDYSTNYNSEYYKIYANKNIGYLTKDYLIPKNKDWIDKWKVFTPEAIGTGDGKTDWMKPILGEPNSLCTQTYMVIGPVNTKEEAENIISYTQTKFFHFLLTLIKNTQHTPPSTYEFIPMQDFSKSWTDKELYAKYKLTQEEINFIESMVRPEIGVKNDK